MFPLKRLSHLFNSKRKRLPVFLPTRRHIAGAVAFGGAAIFISGSAALVISNNWQRPSDSFTPIDTEQVLSLDAIVTEPKTSAIQLAPLSSNAKAQSQ